MISQFFIDIGFNVLDGIFELFPKIEWNPDTSAWQYARDFVDMISYLHPLGTISSIISLIMAVTFFRITIAFIRTIWGFIPFV